jgi:hypothetical protein
MSNLINEFFDLNQPCPDKIPNCQQLREQYQGELRVKRNTGCKSCDETKVRVKYMEIVWQSFMNSLG